MNNVDKRTSHYEADKRKYTTFKRNLVKMVIYPPIRFEFNQTKHLSSLLLEFQSEKC